MARLVDQLTEAKICTLSRPGLYPDGRGLYLQIRSGGSRSWIYRFTLSGRTRDKGLGSLQDLGLMAARHRAAECRVLLAKGTDPIEHEKAERAAARIIVAPSKKQGPTFQECAEKYMDEKLRRLRSEVHRKQWRYSLETFAYPVIGQKSVANINTQDILDVLRPIWETTCETAQRLRGRIERVLARATVEGQRDGINPATWRGHLQEALPARSEVQPVKHHPAMRIEDVPQFIAELRQREEVGAAALQFLILTASRTRETTEARWDEIDLNERTWTIPPTRAKTGRDHCVPLSTGALLILQAMAPLRDVGGGFIFPGTKGRGLSQMTLLALLQRRMGRQVTVHGFRSSFRDWAGDIGAVPREIAEACLAHVLPSKVERAYRRRSAIERRREVMQSWCDYCIGSPTLTVVPRQEFTPTAA